WIVSGAAGAILIVAAALLVVLRRQLPQGDGQDGGAAGADLQEPATGLRGRLGALTARLRPRPAN
ncbi:YscJ/HrcJ family type III secretion apparatus lipoprotein, partial [Burkholderia glumae]